MSSGAMAASGKGLTSLCSCSQTPQAEEGHKEAKINDMQIGSHTVKTKSQRRAHPTIGNRAETKGGSGRATRSGGKTQARSSGRANLGKNPHTPTPGTHGRTQRRTHGTHCRTQRRTDTEGGLRLPRRMKETGRRGAVIPMHGMSPCT